MLLRSQLALLLALATVPPAVGAHEPLPPLIELPRMTTSIYIGSVTLKTSPFSLEEGAYRGSYEARVTPWSFWNETGTVSLIVSPEDYTRIKHGETVEITGEATNDKGKPREVSARVRSTADGSGTVKVRINANGTTLIFNGTFEFPEMLAVAGQ